MAVYQETKDGIELLTRGKTIPEVVAIVQEGKRVAGEEVSPCIKDNLNETTPTT